MRPHADVVFVKFTAKSVQTVVEPCVLNVDPKVSEPNLKQLIVGQGCPEIFPTRHGAKRPAN
jgi:hypothetical protein